jgi:hypothetical protein
MELYRRSRIHSYCFFVRQERGDVFKPRSIGWGLLGKFCLDFLRQDPVALLTLMDDYVTVGLHGTSSLLERATLTSK